MLRNSGWVGVFLGAAPKGAKKQNGNDIGATVIFKKTCKKYRARTSAKETVARILFFEKQK